MLIFSWSLPGPLRPVPVDGGGVTDGNNLDAGLYHPLHGGLSGGVEAVDPHPDGSYSQPSQLLSHVKSSHLTCYIGSLLGIQESMERWSIVIYVSSIRMPKIRKYSQMYFIIRKPLSLPCNQSCIISMQF